MARKIIKTTGGDVPETKEPKAKPYTVYLTDVQKERVEAIQSRRETDNFTRTMGWLVDDEWRRIVEHNTKEDRLTRIEAALETMQKQLDDMRRVLELLQTERWTQIAAPDGKINVTISLDPNDMDRLLQAVKASK
jgi:thioester reductase-like protein